MDLEHLSRAQDSALNAKIRARYKKVLLVKRQELSEGFELARERGSHGADAGDKDYIDCAVSSYTKEFLLSLSDLERQQLVQVDRAIELIAEGAYGTCIECEEEIETKRLDAVPWAAYCLECQDLADRGLLGHDDDDD